MATIWEEFGVAVRTARADRNLTGKELAFSAFGRADRKSYVALIERGGTRLSARTVGKLAKALDLPESVTAPLFRAHLPEEDKLDTDARRLMQMAAADKTTPGTADALMTALAYEFAQGSHIELATAYTALRGALQTAQEMKDQIARLHNMDDRLAAVLARVAEMNDRGETDAAGQELDAAIKTKEAELDALQDAALQQDRLRNDAAAYAKRLVARLHAAAPAGGVFMATAHLLDEWRIRGERQGDPFDLAVALALARINHDRARGPQVGQALLSLGNCHSAIGQRQSGNDHLTRAIRAFTAALKEVPRRSQPENWAATQNNLGTALRALGDREGDTARLHDAVTAYRAALQVRTRDAAPTDWAGTQNNLGTALRSLGDREGDTARLHDAVTAYRAALEVRTRDAAPMDWAGTQNNLGVALQSLGEREGDPARMHDAVAAYRAVQKVRTRDAAPMDWAATQNNLGLALRWLGTLTRDATHFDAAEAALNDGLTVHTRDAVPFGWAKTQWNLADLALARHAVTPDPALIPQARDHLAQARVVFAEAENAHQLAECDRLQALIDAASDGP